MTAVKVVLQHNSQIGQLNKDVQIHAYCFYTMRSSFLLKNFGFFLLISMIFAGSTPAQQMSAPREEKLLNGLKVLFFRDPAAANVSIKVRIHSGTSFDPQGKEGAISLLAENFFPTDVSREFYKEDLGGSFDLHVNYDYIQVNTSARKEDFITLIEAVSAAISNPTIDKETTAKLVAARIAKLQQLDNDPVYIAENAAGKQLFGTFPYGRPILGTAESVAKISFADLMDLEQRFVTSDNATVVISGNFDQALAYRAARRYFGSWLKSDRIIPSTFKQPDAPDTKLVKISSDAATAPQTVFALRGVSRNDSEFAASTVLTHVLESRLRENLSGSGTVFVGNNARTLPGSFVLGISGASDEPVASNLVTLLLSKPISETEFNAARAKANAARQNTAKDEFWLDADTYKTSAATEQKAFDSLGLPAVQAIATRLAKNPVVAVTVSKPEAPATTN